MNPISRLAPRVVRLLLTTGPLFWTALFLEAQVAPNPAPAKSTRSTSPSGEETIRMNPFEVNTAKDTTYGALNSNAISAFNMELFKTPVAADIFTEDFMRDVATTSVEELLSGYGAGFTEISQTPDASNVDNQPGDRVGLGPMGSRGVLASDKRRNGFSKYKVELRPSATFGYTVENAINATFVGQPREYVWTNTISF